MSKKQKSKNKAKAKAKAKVKVEMLELLAGEDTVDVTDQLKAMDDLDKEIKALETHLSDENPRLLELADFTLAPDTQLLLDEACENVSSNEGRGVEDKPSRRQIQERAALLAGCDNDLGAAIDMIVGVVEDPKIATVTIHGLCFAVQKAANFVTNLKYRRALDATSGEDRFDPNGTVTTEEGGDKFFADQREELRDPPLGLGPEKDADPVRTIMDAYIELHDYLQLLTEAFGWDATSPMPYLFTTEDGIKFHAVTDPEMALDVMEVRSQQSRAKRQIKQTSALAAANKALRAQLLKASKANKVAAK